MPTAYESASEPLLSSTLFAKRLLNNVLIALIITSFSLGIGVIGYCHFCNLGFYDGLLNASMILTGMGPVDKMPTDAGKVFASFYALFSGIAYLSMTGLLIAPIFHRFLHRFHLEDGD